MEGVRTLTSATQTYQGILRKAPLLLDAIKFHESIFALPFAYLGMFLAADGFPGWRIFSLITLAMVSARTVGMASNQIIDRHIDARNPRSSTRHLPTGRLRVGDMVALTAASIAVLMMAAALLNTLALVLAPVAIVAVAGYSYVKRFTWLTHFVLGWSDGIAPVGGWIGVTGTLPWEAVLLAFAVAMWIGGFDIFYSCQDIDFDREHGVHSIPQRFGVVAGFWAARVMHLLTSLALLAAFAIAAEIAEINLLDHTIIVGVLFGAMLPFLFSAFTMKAVGRAAMSIVNEVRRQFREIPGLMEGTAEPDYTECVDIATKGALKEMIIPGLMAVAAPLATGFVLGVEALGGMLIGAVGSGFMLAIMMATAGGAWDNAKKYVELGHYGGKGSDAHKAAVEGDVVGDPFKDTSGPSLNILLKLMAIVSLVFAPVFLEITPLIDKVT